MWRRQNQPSQMDRDCARSLEEKRREIQDSALAMKKKAYVKTANVGKMLRPPVQTHAALFWERKWDCISISWQIEALKGQYLKNRRLIPKMGKDISLLTTEDKQRAVCC